MPWISACIWESFSPPASLTYRLGIGAVGGFEPYTGEGRIRAASYLTILSGNFAAVEMAARVGLLPDEQWRKGEQRPRRPLGWIYLWHGISYESGLGEEEGPTEHFSALMKRLQPYVEGIRQLADSPRTQSVRVTVVEHTENENPMAWLEPGDLQIVAAMGAEIFIDTYFYEDREENGS